MIRRHADEDDLDFYNRLVKSNVLSVDEIEKITKLPRDSVVYLMERYRHVQPRQY